MAAATLIFTLTLLSTTVFRVDGYGFRDFGEECIPVRTYIPPSQQGNRYSGLDPNSDPRLQQQYQQNAQQPYQVQIAQSYIPQSNQPFVQPYPQQVDEGNSCKSEKGLRCDEYTRRCRCNDISGATWVYDHYRCELPVDTFCTTQLDYANICVEGAECTCNWESWDRRKWVRCDRQQQQYNTQVNPFSGGQYNTQVNPFSGGSNGRCKCRLGYRAYEDNSGCWYSGVSRGRVSGFLLGVGIFTVFITTNLNTMT